MATSFTQFQAVPIDAALDPQNTATVGKALISNGSHATWNTILSMIGPGIGQTTGAAVANAILPSQSGQAGKVLTTDGNGTLSWVTDQAGAGGGVTSITISGVTSTGAVTITNVPSATIAGNVSGVVAIANGGTGATSAAQALTNLGAAAANHTHNYALLASPAFTGTPTAPTAAAGTNTTQLATTAFVAAAVSAGGGLGYGQTWQDVTLSRAIGSTYTNTTGKPIIVSAMIYNTTSLGQPDINAPVYVNNTLASSFIGSAVVVPVGATYRISAINSNVRYWYELR